MRNVCVLLVLALALTGCAVGNKIDYRLTGASIPVETQKKVTLGVQDAREGVVAGKMKENCVGVSRGGYGNAFKVTTKSGNPLAVDMADAIVAGLKEKGVAVESIALTPSMKREEVVAALTGPRGDRALLVTIGQWRSDTYFSTDLNFQLTAEVLDASGAALAKETILHSGAVAGPQIAGGSIKKNLPLHFRMAIENLLGKPSIVDALK